jgi:hypothetical protein
MFSVFYIRTYIGIVSYMQAETETAYRTQKSVRSHMLSFAKIHLVHTVRPEESGEKYIGIILYM